MSTESLVDININVFSLFTLEFYPINLYNLLIDQ